MKPIWKTPERKPRPEGHRTIINPQPAPDRARPGWPLSHLPR